MNLDSSDGEKKCTKGMAESGDDDASNDSEDSRDPARAKALQTLMKRGRQAQDVKALL